MKNAIEEPTTDDALRAVAHGSRGRTVRAGR